MVKVIILLLLLLASCSYDIPPNACDGHGGIAICYKYEGTTHGHIMCKDGTESTKECY